MTEEKKETKTIELTFDELSILSDALSDFEDESTNKTYLEENEQEWKSLEEKINPLWETWWEERKKKAVKK